MKILKILFLTMLFILPSCSGTHKSESPVSANESSKNYEGPIIDMHIHSFSDGNPMFGLTHPPTLRGTTFAGVSTPQEQQEKTMEKFKKYHIVKAVVTDGIQWSDSLPGTILVGSANKSPDELKEQYEKGQLQVIAEMAPYYQGLRANDLSLDPYFELAQELGIPVGFHILPGGPNSGIHLMPDMLGGMRAYNASPLQLEDVLVKFPKLKLYVMHGGWPYIDDMKALLYAHPNLYLDIAVINWILPQSELNDYVKALFTAGFGDRVMYGSDQMVWPETIDVGIESVNAIEFLTLEQKEDIFFNNASRFLGLSEEEIGKLKKSNLADN